jgi:hypothetical protein
MCWLCAVCSASLPALGAPKRAICFPFLPFSQKLKIKYRKERVQGDQAPASPSTAPFVAVQDGIEGDEFRSHPFGGLTQDLTLQLPSSRP